MTKVNLQDSMEKQEKDAGIDSGYLKLKEGNNRIRLLTAPVLHGSEYKGSINYKHACYIIDREDGNVKLAFLAKTIISQIAAYQNSEDYGFEDVPMPYDVTINAKGAGSKEVKYTVIPAKEEVPLSSSEVQELSQKKPIADVLKRMGDKQGKSDLGDGIEGANKELAENEG